MSGKDERKVDGLPKCPVCKKMPDAWSVGRHGRPVFWLRSKKYAYCAELTPQYRGWAISFWSQRVPLVSVIPGLDYVWCNKCLNKQRDEILIKRVIEASLRLEHTKYEVS